MSKDSRIEALRRQVAVIVEQIDKLENRPEEPRIGQVIMFTVRFDGMGPEYDYAALRAGDGFWYLTGLRSPQRRTWDQLLEWMEGNTFGYRVCSAGLSVNL